MKISFSHQLKKGFTLIELLVVIAILAALAGVGIPTVLGMIEKSNIAAANKVCKDIIAGVEAYKTEYDGALPFNPDKLEDAEADVIVLTTDGENDADFVHIMFNTEIGRDFNPEGKPFIKADTVEDPSGGLYMNDELAALYDPWGAPYQILLSSDGESSLRDPFTNRVEQNVYCMAYSTGPDGLGKHKDLNAPKAKSGKKAKKNNKKKKNKKDEEDSNEPLRYPDYTAAEQDQITDNVYSWKQSED